MLNAFVNYIYLMRNAKLSRDEIKKLQWKKFKKTIKHAYNNVPFYHEKFKMAGLTPDSIKSRKDISKIPITTKEELRIAKNKIFANGYSKKNTYSSKTSGSTGEPFASYFDKQAWSILRYASKLRARRLCGMKFKSNIINIETYNKEKIAKMNKRAWYLDLILKLRYLTVFSDLDEHVTFFKKFKPDSLYGLTSYFVELGDYLERKKIKWEKSKLIFTSGEQVTTATRKKLEKYYGNNIFDIYGTTEVKEVSWECSRHEGYHINEDLYLVEFINETKQINKKQKRTRKDDKILITTFENKAMPLIRYDVGDRGRILKKKCSCGLPFSLMYPSEGRDVDYFILLNNKRVSPYVITMAMETIKGISQYQVIQHTKTDIEVKIRLTSNISKSMRSLIKGHMQKVLDSKVNIKITQHAHIPRDKNGKYVVVKSFVKK